MKMPALTYSRTISFWMLFIVILGWPHVPKAEPRRSFYFGNLPNTYLASYKKESQMAFQMLMKEVFSRKQLDLDLQLDFLPDNHSFLNAKAAPRYDVLVMTSMDYFFLRSRLHLEPLAVLSKCDQPAEPLLLLTRRGHSWETLARQSERTLLMEKGNGESLAKVWGAMLLADRQATRFDTYFSSVRLADKPHRTVLPVFFGRTDMCIVSRSTYDLMLELNPQIADDLAILKESPEFINIIICATGTLDDWAKTIIHEEILAMHTHTVGRQALTLIQMQRFWDFDPSMLKATEALYLWRQRNMAGKNG